MIIPGHCTYTIYQNGNFSVQSFNAMDSVELPNGGLTRMLRIKGDFLPNTPIDVKLEGEFDAKAYRDKTFTFNVTTWEEIKIPEKNNIFKYLTSLRGVGRVLANSIYDEFGDNTFQILDEDIENLKKVQGIGDKKYTIIANDYLARGAAKHVYTYLYQYHVPNKKIEKIYSKYREKSLDTINSIPHSLYLQGLLSFETAERISAANKLDRLSNLRIQACLVESLRQAELNGHTHLNWKNILMSTWKYLNVSSNPETLRKISEPIKENLMLLNGTDVTVTEDKLMYRKDTFSAEMGAAMSAKRLVKAAPEQVDYTQDIQEAEEKLNIKLSDEQAAAVQMVMNSQISIVTGGPGTGKTSFQKVLLDVFEKHNPNSPIVMGAPTGRAARRMTESSGKPARTLHQILGLMVTDEDEEPQDERNTEINAGLMLVDEMSMVDIFLANELFAAIKNNTKIVCIGDVYQLPSVGCGAVLKDLIKSGEIPVTKFTKVFRQADGSIIAANASAINSGNTKLEYGDAFTFIERNNPDDMVSEIKSQYEKALAEYGTDETVVLTPYRRKTSTGVNEMNPVLKGLCNPFPNKTNRYNKVDGMELYSGDKVMFTKNMLIGDDALSNGDIGYITKISVIDNIQTVTVDFQDGRIVNLQGDDLKQLVQAYSMTIHKSQGSEYKCCIIVIDPRHSILLRRNLIYTAITRAKEKVIIIGDKNEFFDSIKREDTNFRNTMLEEYLH